MEVFIDGQKCTKVVNADGLDMNVVFVSESGNLLLVYGKALGITFEPSDYIPCVPSVPSIGV